ncbi:leucyl aminopeptidase [Kribbia dieselivorans]|uniref:leucyl aminopeptidase n=1 Tax=Kribbia dieselivorans TaxID=331526 RepID=UPI000838FF37|nr:leucyl aminopeptidase [Kribbia dieselivorans]
MSPRTVSSTISTSLATKSPADLDVDTLVLASVPDGEAARLADGHDLPNKVVKALNAALAAVNATGKPASQVALPAPSGVKARRVVVTGLGDTPVAEGGDVLRRAAGVATRGATGSVAVAIPHADVAGLAAVVEGALMGAYAYPGIRGAKATDGSTGDRKNKRSSETPAGSTKVTSLSVVTSTGKSAAVAVRRAEVLADAVSWARDLVNTPPNRLTPQAFVEAVQEQVKAAGVKIAVTVLDENELREQGFGGITGVGQGSANPPRIVRLSWTPKSSSAAPVAFVGKGITFDSGGLNIKPGSSMATMKSDMAGAAAVAAATIAAAVLDVRVPVTTYLGLAENMPGGNAQRPGDVVTMRDGTTVEILDTDAEGRMVLGDCLCLASQEGAERIVDVATLTGACVVALGTRVTGVMGNDEAFTQEVLGAAQTAGEQMWPLPLPEDLRASLDSPFADLAHKGDRWGGALTAGLFLERFAATPGDRTPITWAHLDIAGPSYNEGAPWGHVPKGGTGAAVPTLLTLLENHAH